MDKAILNQKLFELQRQFGNAQLKVVDAKREFKTEESLNIFTQHEIRPVIVYFMNNLILITERESNQKIYKQDKITYRLITYVDLDEYSQVKDIEDNDLLQNVFVVVGKNESVTFVSEDSSTKQKRILLIQSLIEDLVGKS